jgi:hypothetical protein
MSMERPHAILLDLRADLLDRFATHLLVLAKSPDDTRD